MGCKLKARCTRSEYRQVRHSIYREAYDRLSKRLDSSAGRMASILRKTGPEPLFAEAKGYHGMRKYMTKGRLNAQKNSLMIAIVQNLKRLMNNWKGGLKQCNVKCMGLNTTYSLINLLNYFYRIYLMLIKKFEYNF